MLMTAMSEVGFHVSDSLISLLEAIASLEFAAPKVCLLSADN